MCVCTCTCIYHLVMNLISALYMYVFLTLCFDFLYFSTNIHAALLLSLAFLFFYCFSLLLQFSNILSLFLSRCGPKFLVGDEAFAGAVCLSGYGHENQTEEDLQRIAPTVWRPPHQHLSRSPDPLVSVIIRFIFGVRKICYSSVIPP